MSTSSKAEDGVSLTQFLEHTFGHSAKGSSATLALSVSFRAMMASSIESGWSCYWTARLVLATLDMAKDICSSRNAKFTEKIDSRLGSFDSYSIDFEVKDVERIGDYKINGFSGKATVYLKKK